MSDFAAIQNKALREAARAIPIAEHVLVKVETAETAEASGRKGYRAKVSHCDRMNQNRRVYPAHEWQVNVERAMTSLIPGGQLIGAVDHAGFLAAGNLKDSAILWKHLEIKPDGEVEGAFEIIEGHSRGKDLKAQIDAGMAIGFSTVGYASGRSPTDAERKKYGIPEDDEDAVIIENYRLKKIDAVDDPSVADAWLKQESAAQEQTNMKTLAELKAQAPDLFALHEQAIADAVSAALQDPQAKLAAAEAKAAEDAAKIEALTADLAGKATELADKAAELEAANAAKAELEAKAAQAEAEAAEAKRQADVKAKAAELLKGNRFAGQIEKAVDAAIADKAFDVAACEALVKAKGEEYEAVAASLKTPDSDITGILNIEDLPKDENQDALPVARELAEAL